jgi:hypothetical protein
VKQGSGLVGDTVYVKEIITQITQKKIVSLFNQQKSIMSLFRLSAGNYVEIKISVLFETLFMSQK